MEVPLLSTNIPAYLVVSDDELESERDSVPTNPIAGPSTPPRNTSTSTPSAPKSSNIARFEEVPETAKLDLKSHLKREHKQTQPYSLYGFARLVLELISYMQAMVSPVAN